MRRSLDMVRQRTRNLLPPERPVLHLLLGRGILLPLTHVWALTRTWPPLYYVEKLRL